MIHAARRRRLAAALLAILSFYVLNAAIAQRGMPNFGAEFYSAQNAQQLPQAYEFARRPTLRGILSLDRELLYPPGYLIEAALIVRVVGKRWLAMNLAHNTAYLLLLLVGVFLLGKRLQDERTGACAALLVACYPLVYGAYPLFSMDFAITSIAALAVWCLYRCDFFRFAGWSAVCGLVCGWGMLVKEPFAAFVAGPLLYGVWSALRAASRKDLKPLRNACLFAVILAALMAPYYLHHSAVAPLWREPADAPWYALKHLRLHTVGLWENQLTPPFFLALLAGGWVFFRRAGRRDRFVLASWILLPNLVVLLMPHHKSPRYLLPQLPALALISAYWLRSMLDRRFGRWLAAAAALIGAAQYYAITYSVGIDLDAGRNDPDSLAYFKIYYDRRDANPTRRFMLGNGAMLRNAEQALLAKIAQWPPRSVPERPVRVMAPFSQDSVFPEPILNSYFWFTDAGLEVVPYPITITPDAFSRMRAEINEFDCLLYAVPWYGLDLCDQGYFAFFRQTFERAPGTASRRPAEGDWIRYEADWKAVRRRLKPCEIIYSSAYFDLYLHRVIR